jgi:hypothetical protein
MTSLVITPSLEKSLVTKRGIVTMPDEDATVSCLCVRGQHCAGIVVNQLPVEAALLEQHMRMMGTKFISRMQARGLEWVGGDLRLHGPWPSYEFNKTMADIESQAWKDAEREDDLSHVLQYVIEQPEQGEYSDYLLVGDFLAQNVFTEVEVPDAAM